MKILYQNLHQEKASSTLIRMVTDLRYNPRSHHCGGEAATVHSKGHTRFIRDLNMANAQAFLQVDYAGHKELGRNAFLRTSMDGCHYVCQT